MKIDNRDVFEQLGNLFYSIAIEQHVKPLEIGELKMLISKDWLPRNLDENKSIVSDETHFMILTIDALQGSQTSAKDAFLQFSKFYSIHSEIFSADLKQRIVDTATKITRIFGVHNPSENANLINLKNLFKGIGIGV